MLGTTGAPSVPGPSGDRNASAATSAARTVTPASAPQTARGTRLRRSGMRNPGLQGGIVATLRHAYPSRS